jgi:hypothetical protein
MKTTGLKLGVVALSILAPVAAGAQGIVDGAANGAANLSEKGNAAGPVGAVVGGIVGAVTGGISGLPGLLGLDQRPGFREYVNHQHLPSDTYRAEVAVGNVLPPTGIQYYDMPPKFGVTGYRYAVVNDVTVLVDPITRRIVEVVN